MVNCFYNYNCSDYSLTLPLLFQGANVDWQDEHNDGLSSLHMAACKGHVEVTKLLIKAGCDVNATDM